MAVDEIGQLSSASGEALGSNPWTSAGARRGRPSAKFSALVGDWARRRLGLRRQISTGQVESLEKRETGVADPPCSWLRV